MATLHPDTKPSHGPVLPSIAALPLSADLKDPLTDLFLALGADADFVGYPTLARVLRDCLEAADRLGLPAQQLRAPHLQALKHLLALEPSPLPDIPRGAHPGGAPSRYPVISGLLGEVLPVYADQATRLRALVAFAALLHQHTLLPPVVAAAAKEIRLAFRPGDVRRDVLARIPELASERLPLGRLAWTAESLRAQRGLNTQQRDFLRALAALAHLCISASVDAERRALHRVSTPLTEELVDVGDGWIEQVRGPDEALFETAADPPDEPFWTFRERPTQDLVSVRGLAAAGRRSRFWLTATTRALPWDRSVLSPIQLDVVLDSLTVKASSPEDAPDRWSGTLLALLLATGLDLEELAALELGEGRQLDATAGVYRRSPPVTAARSHPPRETRQERLPQGAVLELPLPEPVRWLLPSRATGPLGDWLMARTPRWAEAFTVYLSGLDEVAALQVTPRRIGRLIAHRLQQLYDDPAITYLLVGLKRDAMPVELHYAAIPASRLIEAYRQAVRGIFSADS